MFIGVEFDRAGALFEHLSVLSRKPIVPGQVHVYYNVERIAFERRTATR